MRGQILLYAQFLVRAYACSPICPTLQDFQAIVPCSTDTLASLTSASYPPTALPTPQTTWDIFRTTSLPSPPTTATINATCTTDPIQVPIPPPVGSGDTNGRSGRVKHNGAVPGLWVAISLSIIIFLGWMCWEVRKDWQEMMWLEQELKDPPLLQGGGIIQRPNLV
jgi:hypothetical protein